MATAKPLPKARPKQGNVLAAAARRLREGTGLVATAAEVPGPRPAVPAMAAATRRPAEETGLRTASCEDAPLAQASFAQPQPALR